MTLCIRAMTLIPKTRGAPSTDSVPPAFLLRTLGWAELCEIAPSDRSRARDKLAALLWDDSDPEKSRHNVRQALWRLQRVLGDLLVTCEVAEQLVLLAPDSLDAHRIATDLLVEACASVIANSNAFFARVV